MRFGIRLAKPDDALGIARAHSESWRESYRGILPERLLDRVDVGQRAATRSRILADPNIVGLVAYDLTHRDIVGFCDAGESRRRHVVGAAGEIYALYLVHHAKMHGLGSEMFDRCRELLAARGLRSLVIWVLENNVHGRRFYEARGGKLGPTVHSTVGGFPVLERAYLWD
ncbi:MAG TPA: GNAT family N-acetyltransferase [Kofleriaceae bacterium]|nr:GNAT family N-acetyltransferase [Kofleriaceae bacterium]